MTLTIAALLVLAPSTPEGQWGPTSVTAPVLASRVDSALAGLTGITMHFVYVYSGSLGWGMKQCDGTFVSPTKFRLQVPVFDPKREQVVDYETWIADGSRFGTSLSNPFPRPQVPIARRPAGPAHPASSWFGDFSRSLLSGIGQSTHPLARYVADAKAQGYQVSVQMRQFAYRGAQRTWYRLVSTKGPARYEMVFDATGYLPVNAINTNGAKESARWYEVRWKKPRTVDASVARFTAPKSVQGSSPAPRPR